MKLYNRQEFLALPAGVVFAKYEPCYFDQWQIKGDTWLPNDYLDQELVTINTDLYNGEHYEACLNFEEKKTANVDFHNWCRDGLFEDKQLFAVLESHEVYALIARLQETLEEGYATPVF